MEVEEHAWDRAAGAASAAGARRPKMERDAESLILGLRSGIEGDGIVVLEVTLDVKEI